MCERVDTRTVNKKTLEALIKCGACDCFGLNRATHVRAASNVCWLVPRASSATAQGSELALRCAGRESEPEKMPEAAAQLPEWPQHELLAHEKELLGFYVTGHPLTPFAPILEKYCLHNTVSEDVPERAPSRASAE
jgi:DNA polymerase-3 subunit alpha